MIIRKYTAETEEEATRLAQEDLGEDVIILTVRPRKAKGVQGLFKNSQVEVTAAIEDSTIGETKPVARVAPAPQALNETLAPQLEKNTLGSNLAALKASLNPPQTGSSEDSVSFSTESLQRFQQVQPKTSPTTPKEAPLTEGAELRDFSERLLSRFGTDPEESVSPTRTSLPPPSFTPAPAPSKPLIGEEDRLRAIIREEFAQAQKSVTQSIEVDSPTSEKGSMGFLISKGVGPSIARDIQERLDKRLQQLPPKTGREGRSQRLNALKSELASRIQTSGPFPVGHGRLSVIALVGPTGVGKTTTLAKIAAQFAQEGRKKVGLFSFDLEKAGASEQIRSLASSLNLPLMEGSTQEELVDAIAAFQNLDLLLVDTAGRSQYKWEEIESLRTCLAGIDHIHIALTLSAATRDLDLFGTIQQYRRLLTVKSLIVTKLDETIAPGVLVNICDKSGLPISYVAMGQKIPEDLRVCDPQDVARDILMKSNEKEYKDLREMAAQ